ncbi:hypothetical protein AB0K52_17565 [Glycomyces sp. NPDC049804]|uniref:hypothetical protein n=1 Tax=Glycomyces sp. NPDC049804 TaxID=3154363 RepID=UPI003416F050
MSVPQNRPWTLDGGQGDSNRHRKGDTYLIGGKPYDPLDPGPWLWEADPAFQSDRRTGRHRRGELPDPRRPRPYPEPAVTFGKLREDAWTRFLDHSAVLAQAQLEPRREGRFKAALLRALRRITSALR